MMENLLTCDGCKHGAPLHSGQGCETRACECKRTLQDVISDGCEAARIEIRAQWESWKPSY